MGVTYKLKDEVVHFIISERQQNPLLSCRQLAESASSKFSVKLSKSSVHDVLKESGIVTPRGRKPKDGFHIPLEKKKEIQSSLSQVMLKAPSLEPLPPKKIQPQVPLKNTESLSSSSVEPLLLLNEKESSQNKNIYEGAGRIFLKAALWDLGIFSEDQIKEEDWNYYLTYTSGIKVFLENNNSYAIDWRMPLHRSVREIADCLINNIKPLIVHQISDKNMFEASMEAQAGYKIKNISIVDYMNHKIAEFDNIVDFKRTFIDINRIFVEISEKDLKERAKRLFFSQTNEINNVMDNILNLKGFNTVNKDEFTVNIEEFYEKRIVLQSAVEQVNSMFLRDEQNRLLKIRIF